MPKEFHEMTKMFDKKELRKIFEGLNFDFMKTFSSLIKHKIR